MSLNKKEKLEGTVLSTGNVGGDIAVVKGRKASRVVREIVVRKRKVTRVYWGGKW